MIKKVLNKKENIFYVLGLFVISIFFIFLLSVNFINYSLKEKCQLAQNQYDGDCVEALTSVLKDENNSFSSRNSAIWALGQLGDKRALTVLEKYYTGNIPEKEPINKVLSQYELKKAIGYFNGNKNIIRLFR